MRGRRWTSVLTRDVIELCIIEERRVVSRSEQYKCGLTCGHGGIGDRDTIDYE